MTEPKRSKRDIISDWREKNIAELDENLRVWKSIRDDNQSSDKDRIEAAKSIARQLGAMAPDAAAQKAGLSADTSQPKHKDAKRTELEDLLDSL